MASHTAACSTDLRKTFRKDDETYRTTRQKNGRLADLLRSVWQDHDIDWIERGTGSNGNPGWRAYYRP